MTTPGDKANQATDTNSPIAALAAQALTYLSGVHLPSKRAGYKEGYVAGKASVTASAPVVTEKVITQHIAIKIEDARNPVEHRVKFDGVLLDDARFDIDESMKKQFMADAKRLLGEDHQPTPDQWKAILSPTTSAATIGIAGTGKTFVMMMRAVFMHCYLQIPLDEMTILAVSKDCRLDIISELAHLFSRWGVNLSQEDSLKLVKTPRGVLLALMRAVPPLREIVPFELISHIDSGDEDGRPFDPRLAPEQLAVINEAYQFAYSNNANFAKQIKQVFTDAIALSRAPADNEVLNRYSEIGNAQLSDDAAITSAITAAWHAAGSWPVPEIEAKLEQITIMGRNVQVNGYIPAIDSYVVLGAPKAIGRSHCRAGTETPLYEESLAKRAYLQRFAQQRIIWVESPEKLTSIIESLQKINSEAPMFTAKVKGQERPMGIGEALYQTAALIETLGLEPAKAISELSFMPNDPDAAFFDCVAMFWPQFESFLLSRTPQSMTFNRLFMTLGVLGANNLRGVPTSALKSMRNVLTDELQDVTIHTGEFIKACMIENRHRMELDDQRRATLSVFACGDDFQTAHGTQGATPQFLTDFRKHFPAKGHVLNILGTNFRSQQGIIFSAHSLISGIPAISMMAPASATNEEVAPVEVYNLNAGTFYRLFDMHYGSGDSILILAANPDDYKASEEFVASVVDRDKRDNPDKRQVRVRAAQRSKGLEADVVFIIGDFIAATSTWAKNQFFRSAQTVETEGQSPFDTIQQNELYRLAHIGITRARKKCFWLIGDDNKDGQHKLRASTRIGSAAGAFKDNR